jgi:dihydrofolate reductase
MPEITTAIVVAVSENGVIGRDGDMPWKLSTDLKRFKALTLGKPVVMGRKTFQSIGRPLPGRPNIVVTRDPGFSVEGITTALSLEDGVGTAKALAAELGVSEICIIGGGDIYRQSLAFADTVHVTHVEAKIDGDTFFPPIDPTLFAADEAVAVPAGEKDNYPTRFVSYHRRAVKS